MSLGTDGTVDWRGRTLQQRNGLLTIRFVRRTKYEYVQFPNDFSSSDLYYTRASDTSYKLHTHLCDVLSTSSIGTAVSLACLCSRTSKIVRETLILNLDIYKFQHRSIISLTGHRIFQMFATLIDRQLLASSFSQSSYIGWSHQLLSIGIFVFNF